MAQPQVMWWPRGGTNTMFAPFVLILRCLGDDLRVCGRVVSIICIYDKGIDAEGGSKVVRLDDGGETGHVQIPGDYSAMRWFGCKPRKQYTRAGHKASSQTWGLHRRPWGV